MAELYNYTFGYYYSQYGIAENGVIFQVVTISLRYTASTSLFVFH